MFENKKIYQVTSPVSGVIEVWQDRWLRRLVIWGAVQSVYRIRGWDQGYWTALVPDNDVSNALILGLGGGTVARLLRKKWPDIRIVAYELDPVIIKVAQDYFDLDKKVEIRLQDYRQALKTNEKFDLIVVDLYLGSRFLGGAKTEDFLRRLTQKLTPHGRVAINRVREVGSAELAKMEEIMKRVFKKSWQVRVGGNIIYWGEQWT